MNKRFSLLLIPGGLLLAASLAASAQPSVSGGITLPGLGKTTAAASITIPLRTELSITTSSSGKAGTIEATQKIVSVTPKTVKLNYSATKPDGSRISANRAVRVEDLKSATAIRPNYVDGSDEFFSGTTAFGTSAKVLSDLKQGGRSQLSLDAGGISMNAGVQGAGLARELDGMLGDMGGFAGIAEALERQSARGTLSERERAQGAATLNDIDQLQMLGGTLRYLRSERVPVEVNGRKAELPGIVAIGDLGKAGESYDVELVFLDDPANPLTLRSRVGKDSVRVTRISFPQ